jgi:hypothetical protein
MLSARNKALVTRNVYLARRHAHFRNFGPIIAADQGFHLKAPQISRTYRNTDTRQQHQSALTRTHE